MVFLLVMASHATSDLIGSVQTTRSQALRVAKKPRKEAAVGLGVDHARTTAIGLVVDGENEGHISLYTEFLLGIAQKQYALWFRMQRRTPTATIDFFVSCSRRS